MRLQALEVFPRAPFLQRYHLNGFLYSCENPAFFPTQCSGLIIWYTVYSIATVSKNKLRGYIHIRVNLNVTCAHRSPCFIYLNQSRYHRVSPFYPAGVRGLFPDMSTVAYYINIVKGCKRYLLLLYRMYECQDNRGDRQITATKH